MYTLLDDFPELDNNDFERNKMGRFYLHKVLSQFSFDSTIDALSSDIRVVRVSKILRINERSSVMIGDGILCKFKVIVPQSIIDSLCDFYFVEIITESEFVSNQFLLRVTEQCPQTTIDMANTSFELSLTDWSHPDFVGNCWADGYTVQDIYYNLDQWNVARTVDHISDSNYGAWEITAGSPGVIVAVLDQGMESHTDLDTTLWDGGFDFVDDDFDPSPVNPEPDSVLDDHGMQVLGLIAGMHNNFVPQPGNPLKKTTDYYSVAGVSPQSRVLPLRVLNSFGSGVEASLMAQAIMVAKNVESDVINCSWGYVGIYPDVVKDAIDSALLNGRDGKGCIVVASVGQTGFLGLPPHPPAAQDSVI